MRSALIIQAIVMIVLVVATMITRRDVWRTAHVWLIAVGATMLAVYLLVNVRDIERWWAGWLTAAMILKNLSLTALLAETFMKRHRIEPPKSESINECGRDFADAVESIRTSSRLAAAVRAGTPGATSNGDQGAAH